MDEGNLDHLLSKGVTRDEVRGRWHDRHQPTVTEDVDLPAGEGYTDKYGNITISPHAYDFDIVSLDYNLGGQLNGADVAKILKYSRHKNVRVIVHSLNPKGAKAISLILPDAIVYPVAKMVRSFQAF